MVLSPPPHRGPGGSRVSGGKGRTWDGEVGAAFTDVLGHCPDRTHVPWGTGSREIWWPPPSRVRTGPRSVTCPAPAGGQEGWPAGVKTPRRRADLLQFGETLPVVQEPDPLAFVQVLFACSEDAGIPQGRGQHWMLDKPCVSSLLLGSAALGPGRRRELCQQGVICKEEISFADIIKTPLSGHMLGRFLRPFPSTAPAWPTYCHLSGHVSPGAVLSPSLLSASRYIFLEPESDCFQVLPCSLRGSPLL